MLAYVFWHTRSPVVSQETYERNLLAFYSALKRADCPGVKHAATFRVSSIPWSDDEAGYEDWAVIAGAWALEGLNAKAVEGSMEIPHADIATLMGSGNGGVYYHLWGDFLPYRADRAQWLSRPRGIKFRPPLEKIGASAGGPISVWRRFMVLGPGPEFIIFGQAPLALELPEGWQKRSVNRMLLPASDGVT